MADFDVGPYRTAAPVPLPGPIKPRVLGYHTNATFRLVLTKTGAIVYEKMGLDSMGHEAWIPADWPNLNPSAGAFSVLNYEQHQASLAAAKVEMQAILKCLLEAHP